MPIKALTRTLASILFITILVGCTTYEPKVAKRQPYLSEDCELVTRKLYLNKFKMKGAEKAFRNSCGSVSACAGLMLGSGIWTAGSLVVSGSLTATGNIVHWLEYQGRCELDEIKKPLLDLSSFTSST